VSVGVLFLRKGEDVYLLVLRDQIVTMKFLILFFPDAEEVGPNSSERLQGPHSSGSCFGKGICLGVVAIV
jgi:hypothetical protein